MVLPEVGRCPISVLVDGHAEAAGLLAKSVTHGGDRLHGQLFVDVLGLVRDDAVIILDVGVRVLTVLGFVLEFDLLL